MAPIPKDQKMYNRIKAKVYRDNPVHSAYRSATVVKQYKASFSRKYGKSVKPYKNRKNAKTGLTRWLNEEWRNQRGEVGYRFKSDIYRPTKRITAKTPKTFKELKPSTIKRARRSKARTGHAYFR